MKIPAFSSTQGSSLGCDRVLALGDGRDSQKPRADLGLI